ncbi:uncharacterized protein LOC113795033 [Dermatophagoides pteronyssinus]|uniref:uncharacterized protein LOC113795033 n=1 Tax=Dermatophagoides pteronyssinus TaxID=6956 RepID=UPI003F67D855
MFRSIIICLWTILAIEFCSAYYYTEPYERNEYDNGNGAYEFSYQTGANNEPDLAQSFREESRDEYGNVHGKYGYVDPYGQLRIVKYRAGSDGYYAEGDIGVDQETLRQQRLLYENDQATKIQQQTWQQAPGQVSSSSAASAAASASSSSSSTGGYYGNGKTDWTTVPDNSINQQYNIKGGSSKNIYSERIVAETPTIPRAPVKYGNYYSNQYNHQRKVLYNNNQYQSPVVRQYYSQKTIQPAARYYQTKSVQQYSGALKSPTARLTEIQQQPQQPAAVVTPYKSLTSAYKSAASSAASAASSASASASSSTAYSPAASYSSVKGGYQQQSQPQRSSRYSIPGTGQSHAHVNFKQFGPAAFQYSYAF